MPRLHSHVQLWRSRMSIFSLFTDPIENILDVVDDALDGELDKHKVAALLSTGLTIAMVADMFGVAEDVIQNMMED